MLTMRIHERLDEAFSPKTVKIGDQVWMAEYLDIHNNHLGVAYNNETNTYYYSWWAAQEIAKTIVGWHLPTLEDFGKISGESGHYDDAGITYWGKYPKLGNILLNKLGITLVGAGWFHKNDKEWADSNYMEWYGAGEFTQIPTQDGNPSRGGFCIDISPNNKTTAHRFNSEYARLPVILVKD